MNTIEKLYRLHESKDKPAYKALPITVREKINQMWAGLKWIWENSDDGDIARASKEAQTAFWDYYESEDASLIKNAYDEVFSK